MEGWLIFGAPVLGAVIAGFGLIRDWGSEQHRPTETLAIALVMSAALLGIGTLACVVFVHELPAFVEYSIGVMGCCFRC